MRVGIYQSKCVKLTPGWNHVVLPRIAGIMTTEAACEQIAAQGGAVSEIDRWDAPTGNWAGHICGLPFGDFQMTPEEGYFVKSGTESVWRPEGGSGSQTMDDGRWTTDGGRRTANGQRLTQYAISS